MISSFIHDLKDAPSRLAGRRQALGRRARTVEVRLWQAQTETLEKVGAWLHETPRALGPLTGAAGKLVDKRLGALTTVPVAGYDELNARDASRTVRDLESRVALLVIRRHEEATKNRKTVLRAVEEQIARLEAPAETRQTAERHDDLDLAEPAAS